MLTVFRELGVNTELYALVFGSPSNDAVAIVLYPRW